MTPLGGPSPAGLGMTGAIKVLLGSVFPARRPKFSAPRRPRSAGASVPGMNGISDLLTARLVASGRSLIEPRLAPDGLSVVFATQTAQGSQLMRIDLGDGASEVAVGFEVQVTVDPAPAGAHPEGGGSFDWFPDGSALVYVAKGGGLYRVARHGGVGSLIVAAPPNVPPNIEEIPTEESEPAPAIALWSPTVSPDGRFVAFVIDDGKSHEIGVALVSNGAIIRVTNGELPKDTRADFRCDPAWAPGGVLVWHEWSAPNMPWDMSRIVGVRISSQGDVVERFVVAEGESLAVGQPRGASSAAIGWLDDRDGWKNVRVRMVADPNTVLFPAPESFEHGPPTWGPGARSWCFSPDGRNVAFVRNEGGFARLNVVPFALHSPPGDVRELGKGQHLSVSWATTPDGHDRICAVRSGGRTPTQIVVYDVETAGRTVVARGPVGAWDGISLPEPAVITWSATDGVDVHGRWYQPLGNFDTSASEVGAPSPLIVSLHGGPTSQAGVDFNQRIVHWLAQGWAVFVPDHRGSTGWGRDYQQAMKHRWGDLDVSDCCDGVRHATAMGWCDPTRVVVMGGSAGGFTALHLLERYPTMFAGGVALYPVCDLIELDATTHRYEAHYNQTLVGPFDEATYRDRSPVSHAANIHAPLLLLHGDADDVVSVAQSRAIAAQLESLGRDVELVVYEGEGHGWRRSETRQDEITRIDVFLQRILAGKHA